MLEFGNIDKRLRNFAHRFNAIILRGVVSNFKKGKKPLIQAKIKAGVVQDNIPFWQNAGISSYPSIDDKSDTLIVALDGDASKRIAVICTGSDTYKLEADKGELVLSDTSNKTDKKNYIKLKSDGIEICLGSGNLNIKDNTSSNLSPIARIGDKVEVNVTYGSSAGLHSGVITSGSKLANSV